MSEEITTNRPAHLYKPGQSGNPKGRPKGSAQRLTRLMDTLLDTIVPDDLLVGPMERYRNQAYTYAEVIAMTQLHIAAFPSKRQKSAATAAYREILNRIDGKVPLVVTSHSQHDHTITVLTPDERKQRLLQLTSKASDADVIDAEFTDLVAEPQSDANDIAMPLGSPANGIVDDNGE